MYDLFTWATPNGRKISIALEELNLSYKVIEIDITKGEQNTDDYFLLNPNRKIPVLVDKSDDSVIIESGAILLYLANKYNKLISNESHLKMEQIQWLFWQCSTMGPMLGQAHHFLHYNKGSSIYSERRYYEEAKRIYRILDRRLDGYEFICGEYSIVDIASWPWVARFSYHKVNLHEFPNVREWYLRISGRNAVRVGYSVPFDGTEIPIP